MQSSTPRASPSSSGSALSGRTPRVSPNTPLPNTSRYERIRLLGQGGMGVVYEVLDRRRERRVAMKVLKDPERGSLYRFKREFRAAADLLHPNLVRLYDLGVLADGAFFFTMELVQGVSLSEFARNNGFTSEQATLGHAETLHAVAQTPGPAVDLIRVLSGIAEGLAALHQAKKVHRDLKPGNVMIEAATLTPKLLDFGIMRDIDAPAGATKGALGTPLYMAPEQVQGQGVDWPADMYSLGCLLYELLTGRPPFQGNSARVMVSHLSEEPALPSSLRPCDAVLERLCLDLLEKDPARRPSAREVVERLHRERGGPVPRPQQRLVRVPVLFGRDRELAQLRSWLLDARPSVVLLEGASGSGKSALCDEFAHQAQEQGELVWLGRCYEREQVPYKALDAIVDSLAGRLLGRTGLLPDDLPPGTDALSRLFPVLLDLPVVRGVERDVTLQDARAERERALQALFALLSWCGDNKPPLLLLEDIHWADPESLDVLRWLLGPEAPAARLLISARADSLDLWPELAERLRERRPERLRVGPLSDGAIEEMIEAHAAISISKDAKHRLAQEARGNPFLASELARAIAERGEDQPPPTLPELLAWRLGTVSERSRGVFEIAAVAAGRVNFSLFLSLAKLSPGALSEALDELLHAGLLREAWGGEESYDISDARYREVAYAALPKERRQALHRALAERWAELGDSGRAVEHWRQAEDFQRARDAAQEAAFRAESQLAFARAADLYALANEGHAAPELYLARAEALRQAGLHGKSATAYQETAVKLPKEEARDLLLRAAAEHLAGGDLAQGLAGLEALLQPLGETIYLRRRWLWFFGAMLYSVWLFFFWFRHDLAELLGWRRPPRYQAEHRFRLHLYSTIFHCLMPLDPFVAVWYGIKSTRLAHLLRDPASLGLVRIGKATIGLGWAGRRAANRAYRGLEYGEALCAEHGSLRGLLDAQFARALLHLYEGNLPGLSAVVERSEEIARRGGLFGDPLFVMMRDMSIAGLYFVGDYPSLELRCQEALSEARARGSQIDTGTPLVFLGMHALSLQQVEKARAYFQEALAAVPAEPMTMPRFRVELCSLELHLIDGTPERGLERLRELRHRWRKSGGFASNFEESTAALLEAQLRLCVGRKKGKLRGSLGFLSGLRFTADGTTPLLRLVALRTEAAILYLRGWPRLALRILDRSVRIAEQQHNKLGLMYGLAARAQIRSKLKRPGADFDRERSRSLMRDLNMKDSYFFHVEGWENPLFREPPRSSTSQLRAIEAPRPEKPRA